MQEFFNHVLQYQQSRKHAKQHNRNNNGITPSTSTLPPTLKKRKEKTTTTAAAPLTALTASIGVLFFSREFQPVLHLSFLSRHYPEDTVRHLLVPCGRLTMGLLIPEINPAVYQKGWLYYHNSCLQSHS